MKITKYQEQEIKETPLRIDVESPANIVHFISNDSNCLARILVLKAPRPVSLTKVL